VHSELTSQFRIILGVFFALVYADAMAETKNNQETV